MLFRSEAEAFGRDIDWLNDALTPSRDLPEVVGLNALKHDLAAVAVLNPGELVHRPQAGVGLRQRVNSSSTEATLREAEADVSAAFLADEIALLRGRPGDEGAPATARGRALANLCQQLLSSNEFLHVD